MIQLTKKYYLDAIPFNFVLKEAYVSKEGKNKGELGFYDTYYSSMSMLLKSLGNEILREGIIVNDIKTALKEIRLLRDRVEGLLEIKTPSGVHTKP